ncbi:MAG TPA: hypothetical protein VLX92_23350 [Kofleriaceae bacterium]|nr:hypothetical protein [Kofleriaceae bacterium]
MIRARHALALALTAAAIAPAAWAKGKAAAKADKDDSDDDDKASKSDDSSSDDSDSDDSDDADDAKSKPKDKDKDSDKDKSSDTSDESSETDQPANRLTEKQDLNGHDLGGLKKANSFENNRFFIDKVDTAKTENGTLIQGAITSTNFFYTEGGGNYPVPAGTVSVGSDAAHFSREFTDLRLQTDFRHIGGNDTWDARFDGRLRLVNSVSEVTPDNGSVDPTGPTSTSTPITATHIQSGLDGQNEYELRELWLIRNGERTDVIVGRQFIADMAAIKIDGVRVDYASSKQLTFLGFAGLYPLRGSRSLSTDYIDLKYSDGSDAGRFVGAAGFGGAYRTQNAYGAVGGVVLYPLEKETPRIFGTSNGYWRYGSTLDFYHFAVVDLIGNNDALGAGSAGLTNLSAGVNYKPNPRLRLTASYNRVDTETLNVQAYAFLEQPNEGITGAQSNVVQNEVFISRLSTNELRGSISAGLGPLQRFEVTVASAYRIRPSFTLSPPQTPNPMDPTPESPVTTIPAAESAELYGSVTDRHSIADLRIGADAVRTFGVGSIAYQRSDILALRAFAAHDIKNGQGEWEAEVAYSTSEDKGNASSMGMCALPGDVLNCFGETNGTVLSIGGTAYYRFNRDWMGIASFFLSRTDLKEAGQPADPTITGVTGLVRLAYRF